MSKFISFSPSDWTTSRSIRFGFAACVASAIAFTLWCSPMAGAAGEIGKPPSTMSPEHASPVLEDGFRQLYQLNFTGARAAFLRYREQNPADPVGKAAEAASYLYEQFDAKGIFTSEFFLDNKKLFNGVEGTPAENRNAAFLRANRETREMAQKILKSRPRDVRALLALTIADGMESDYDALIVKKQAASLGLMRQAEREANTLLAIDPSQDDAYVALGASDYIIGCMPGYKRAFLWFGGIHGDRARGIQEMQRAADHGHYLQPFAEIILALAFEREHQPERARELLAHLSSEFPANKRFARELALLNAHVGGD